MAEQQEPWAFVLHKDGYLGGVTVADKDAAKFMAGFVRKGYAVTTVYNRDEYLALVSGLKRRIKKTQTPS